jgi:hypothetical protein
MHDELKKCHPRLQPSDWLRLAFGDSEIILHLLLGEGAPALSTWAYIASWPMWPFHFFYRCFPADVTCREGGLDRYCFSKRCFHRAYK